MSRYFSFLVLFIALICSCDISYPNNTDKGHCLSVNEARFEYDRQSSATRSFEIDTGCFFNQTGIVPIWEKCSFSESEDCYYCDVPVYAERIYRLIIKDGDYYRLFESHHSITIIKEKSSGAVYVFNHYFIPVLSSLSSPQLYNGKLYRSFYGRSERTEYTGFEVYATMTGRIVSFSTYDRGSQQSHVYTVNNPEIESTLISFLRSIVDVYYCISTNTRSDYVCPYCGQDVFWEDEYLGYICAHCYYFSFYDGEIEASHIIGEYSGGGDWSNGTNPPPIDPGDPNHQSENGGDGSGQNNPSLHNSLTTHYSNASNITLCYPDSLSPETIASLNSLITAALDSISINANLASLWGGLEGTGITFVYDTTIYYPATTIASRNEIHWKNAQVPIITEELFHVFQHLNPIFSGLYLSNYEFEAKCYLACVFSLDYLTSLYGSLSSLVWNNAAAYMGNRSDINRMNLVGSLQYIMGYDMSTISYLTNMLPNIDMLDIGVEQ